ncbi:MAG: GNAT family N-acetyltransferase [Actinomycetota bacterium]
MTADEEIRRLEATADRAWPPAEVHAYDGWDLRATGPGIGRRVNSVAPVDAGTLPLEQKVLAAEAFYRERALPPIFKLTAAVRPAALEAFLAERGYRVDAPVLILTRPLEPAGGPPPRLPEAPAAEWLAANAGIPNHYGAAPAAFLDLLGRIRQPLAFAALRHEDEVAAIGMAVADGGWVGLFEIGTLPRHRRRGLAAAAMEVLLAWGAGQRAQAAYLQVMEDNAPARALYARLGFEEAYRYWYRVGA